MAASLCFKSCEDHSLLKSYNGGLWKTFTGLGPVPYFKQLVHSNYRHYFFTLINSDFSLDQSFVAKAKHGYRFLDLVHIQVHVENSPDLLKSC